MGNVKDEDALIKNIDELMVVKFDKYWDEYGVSTCILCNFRPKDKDRNIEF